MTRISRSALAAVTVLAIHACAPGDPHLVPGPDAGSPDAQEPCVPQSAAAACGAAQCGEVSDGCDGKIVCGVCPDETPFCSQGKCYADTGVDCDSEEDKAATCGDSRCGSVRNNNGCFYDCGGCPANHFCDASNRCVCQPKSHGKACADRQCGPADDGCGFQYDCGGCGFLLQANATCNAEGQCTCTPDCTGKICGSDGCSGVCGPGCPASTTFCLDGTQCCWETNTEAGHECL